MRPTFRARPRSCHPSPSYWHRVRRLTFVLLAFWFATTFGMIFFARELSAIALFGWPLSFYMAAQGSILVYLLIVGVYAWRMRRIDRMASNEAADGK